MTLCTCLTCGQPFEWWNARATLCPAHRPKPRYRVVEYAGKAFYVPVDRLQLKGTS